MKKEMLCLIFGILLIGVVYAQNCIDSDGGENYNQLGEVNKTGLIFKDRCEPDGLLKEYFCQSDNEEGFLRYTCPNGCKDGACIQNTAVTCENINGVDKFERCLNSSCYYDERTSNCYSNKISCEKIEDVQNDLYVKGIVYGFARHVIYPNLRIASYDYCQDNNNISNNNLYQVYCDNQDYATYKLYNCPNGCKDGACIKDVSQCTDSDGGDDIYVKGVTSMGNESFTDYCGAGSQGYYVAEGYCQAPDHIVTNVIKDCPNSCSDGACIKGTEISEEVKCVFKNSKTEEKCYTAGDNSRAGCSGEESCTSSIEGYSGEEITWKSSCGGYGYTKQDGVAETVSFDCSEGETDPVEIKDKGFFKAFWMCYDGEESSSDSRTCVSSEYWQEKAKKFCDGHCYTDGSKCGVNSFSVFDECYMDEIETDCSMIDCVSGNAYYDPVDGCVCGSVKEFQAEIICQNSCPLDEKCYPFGYRKSGEYCSDSGMFIKQLESEEVCENNFECGSNVCVSGECISEGFLQKIINWFKRLFGGE